MKQIKSITTILRKSKIKSITNLFKLKTEKKAINNRIIRIIRTLFQQEHDYYKCW